ncbi:hypothetical protein [Amycolatopsis sp. NPDC004378]
MTTSERLPAKLGVAAAVATLCVLATGEASAATAYTFDKAIFTQTTSTAACPGWVAYPAYCLDVSVTGKASNGATITSAAQVALQSDGTRAERRGTIATPTGSIPFSAVGTYNPSDGSAYYEFTRVNPDGTFASIGLTVDPPTANAATETWKGKIGTR